MRTKLGKERVATQVPKVREEAQNLQVKDLKVVVQIKSKANLDATKTTETHWRENLSAVEVTHAAERRTALAKLEETGRNEAVQQTHTISAEKISAMLQELVKEVMTEKIGLAARCDELDLENRCVSRLAEAKN